LKRGGWDWGRKEPREVKGGMEQLCGIVDARKENGEEFYPGRFCRSKLGATVSFRPQ
jgi:hypothetical protein